MINEKLEIQSNLPYAPNKSKDVIPNVRANTGKAELKNNTIVQFPMIPVIEVAPFLGRCVESHGSEYTPANDAIMTYLQK